MVEGNCTLPFLTRLLDMLLRRRAVLTQQGKRDRCGYVSRIVAGHCQRSHQMPNRCTETEQNALCRSRDDTIEVADNTRRRSSQPCKPATVSPSGLSGLLSSALMVAVRPGKLTSRQVENRRDRKCVWLG